MCCLLNYYHNEANVCVWERGSALGGRAVECVVFHRIPWVIGIVSRKCHGSVTEVSRKCHNIALSFKG